MNKSEDSFQGNYEKNHNLLKPLSNSDPDLMNYVSADTIQINRVNNAEDEFSIEYGYSFGECKGFCQMEIKFTSEGSILKSKRWSDNMNKIEFKSISKNTYDSIIKTIDYNKFLSLKQDLGCGDCADGGLEWLEIKKGDKSKKIGGTYGYNVECVQGILDYFRNR